MNLSVTGVTSKELPGGLEVTFSLFDHPITVTLERQRHSVYRIHLGHDCLGEISRTKSYWSTPTGVTTRSHQVAAYVTVLWWLYGRERGEL